MISIRQSFCRDLIHLSKTLAVGKQLGYSLRINQSEVNNSAVFVDSGPKRRKFCRTFKSVARGRCKTVNIIRDTFSERCSEDKQKSENTCSENSKANWVENESKIGKGLCGVGQHRS